MVHTITALLVFQYCEKNIFSLYLRPDRFYFLQRIILLIKESYINKIIMWYLFIPLSKCLLYFFHFPFFPQINFQFLVPNFSVALVTYPYHKNLTFNFKTLILFFFFKKKKRVSFVTYECLKDFPKNRKIFFWQAVLKSQT